MKRRSWRFLGVPLLVLLAGGASEALSRQAPQRLQSLYGAWQESGGSSLILFEPDRVVGYSGNRQVVQGVIRYVPGVLTVRNQGVLETWNVSLDKGVLRLDRTGSSSVYRRLSRKPSQVLLQPFPLGRSAQVSAERIKSIQEELRERLKKDQEVLKSPELKASVEPVLSDNLRYLKGLVRELGWIDAGRFGKQASADSILIAKHGNDLALEMTILPFVEKDFKSTADDAQMFTVLYDGVQIDLGRKQRYGTQLGVDSAGDAFVLPMENPDRVDELRKELGLVPLSEYLAVASRDLFGGKQIRLPRPDE